MDLQFSTEGQVSGGGVDDVGQYVIYGKHQRYEISFTKTYGSASQSSAVLAWAQVEWHSSDEGEGHFARLLRRYQRGTPNAAGFVLPVDNRGHSVHYTGAAAAIAPSGLPALGSGICGKWSLSAGGHDEGRWHLWPVMSYWTDEQMGDNSEWADAACEECCVCMHASINTRLEPCGHVALCSSCVSALRDHPKKCPLCRAPIQAVRRVRARTARDRAAPEID
jgi:hypothetical protein